MEISVLEHIRRRLPEGSEHGHNGRKGHDHEQHGGSDAGHGEEVTHGLEQYRQAVKDDVIQIAGIEGGGTEVDPAYDKDIYHYHQPYNQRNEEENPHLGELLQDDAAHRSAHGAAHSGLPPPLLSPQPCEGGHTYEDAHQQEDE